MDFVCFWHQSVLRGFTILCHLMLSLCSSILVLYILFCLLAVPSLAVLLQWYSLTLQWYSCSSQNRSRSELWCLLLQTGQNLYSYLASNDLDVCWWSISYFNLKVWLFCSSFDRPGLATPLVQKLIENLLVVEFSFSASSMIKYIFSTAKTCKASDTENIYNMAVRALARLLAFGNFWQTTCQRIRHKHRGNTPSNGWTSICNTLFLHWN